VCLVHESEVREEVWGNVALLDGREGCDKAVGRSPVILLSVFCIITFCIIYRKTSSGLLVGATAAGLLCV